jgi:hypothetical protein
MNKEIFLSYLAGMFDNCGKLSLKKDGRTKKSIYPVRRFLYFKKIIEEFLSLALAF